MMMERLSFGELPAKHHLKLVGPDGALRFEECLTREGFDGPYTILYHLSPPQRQHQDPPAIFWPALEAEASAPLGKRHFVTPRLGPGKGPALGGRIPLAFNEDVVVSLVQPAEDDPAYFANGDGDDLYYIHEGGGELRTPLGDLRFTALDYVYVPKGLPHRFLPQPGLSQVWLSLEAPVGFHLPRQWRNSVGQLRMDAPYCHRDFQRPSFRGPLDEGIRQLVVKRGGRAHGFRLEQSPLDVVGWDGTVYPWVFPILNFQPRVGLTHLPPTWHGTFAAKGVLVCSFVPRLVDFHPEAVPCPYPHSSVDCDELIFYCRGNFTSRRGVGPGSVSFHPAGIPHGPHPGAYEASIGTQRTDELAVMLDTFRPLRVARQALPVEDPGYQESFFP